MVQTQSNHYRVLDVAFTANRKEITAAYRKAMRRWHPDQFKGSDTALAEEYARLINQAYSVLADPHKRAEYDRSLRIEAMQGHIMERYVAGSSGWNLENKGPLPADAPRRPMTTRQRQEVKASERRAMRGLINTFALFALAAIILLVVFSLLGSGISATF